MPPLLSFPPRFSPLVSSPLLSRASLGSARDLRQAVREKKERGGPRGGGGLCGRRRLGIMYFIMISQQNCNLQRAMSHLLLARALSLLVSLSLLSLPLPLPALSLSVALSSSPCFSHPAFRPLTRRAGSRSELLDAPRDLRSK